MVERAVEVATYLCLVMEIETGPYLYSTTGLCVIVIN
jgi:hypothetical protein